MACVMAYGAGITPGSFVCRALQISVCILSVLEKLKYDFKFSRINIYL